MIGDGLYLKQGVKLLAAMAFFLVQILRWRIFQFSVGCCESVVNFFDSGLKNIF